MEYADYGPKADGGNVTIKDCYNTGELTSSFRCGGIIGPGSEYAQIQNCYNIGKIIKSDNTLNENGVGIGNGNLINCYYLDETAEKGTSTGDAIGKCEPRTLKYVANYSPEDPRSNPYAFMKTSYFVDVLNAGGNNWKLVDGVNNNYPVLSCEYLDKQNEIFKPNVAEYNKLDSTVYYYSDKNVENISCILRRVSTAGALYDTYPNFAWKRNNTYCLQIDKNGLLNESDFLNYTLYIEQGIPNIVLYKADL